LFPGAFLSALSSTRGHSRQIFRRNDPSRHCGVRSRSVDIRDEAFLPGSAASTVYRTVSGAAPSALISAIQRPHWTRCLNDPSRHRGRPQYVDICDEASVLKPSPTMAYRASFGSVPDTLTSAIERSYRIHRHNDPSRHYDQPQYFDICDEASVLSAVASMAHRAISARTRYVDIRDRAFVSDPPS